jgi:hypothetical protein
MLLERHLFLPELTQKQTANTKCQQTHEYVLLPWFLYATKALINVSNDFFLLLSFIFTLPKFNHNPPSIDFQQKQQNILVSYMG